MKISAKSGAFAKALSIVNRAAARKATVPILSAIAVEAKDGVLTFRATDNEMSMVLKSGAAVEEEGKAAIPAHMLNGIVSQLPEGDITLETDENGATLSTATSSYTLRTYDADEFPVLPEFDREAAFSLPSKGISDAVSRASAAASDDQTRAVLCGLLASFSAAADDGAADLTMASTDSYRLALYKSSLEEGPKEDKKAVIPAGALAEVARLADMAETVEVMLTENQALFKVASVVISTRLIDGTFPEYERLLPESFAHEFEVPAQGLRESLKRANLFSGASSKAAKRGSPGAPVRFAFSREEGSLAGGRLTLSSKSEDTGQATETLDATVPESESGSPEFVTAFNGRYIAEGVAQMIAAGAESIRFQANDPLKPIVLAPAATEDKKEGPDYQYLIMPMRDPYAEETASA